MGAIFVDVRARLRCAAPPSDWVETSISHRFYRKATVAFRRRGECGPFFSSVDPIRIFAFCLQAYPLCILPLVGQQTQRGARQKRCIAWNRWTSILWSRRSDAGSVGSASAAVVHKYIEV